MGTETVQPHDKSNYRAGFWAFITTQFQGAFSDNVFKWIIVYLLLYSIAETGDVETSTKIAAIAGMVFAVPYILFPGIFGAISDRFSKQRVISATKLLEVVIMIIGGVAIFSFTKSQEGAGELTLFSGPILFLWAIFILMATQSALFGPAKYGILPESLPDEKLSMGNGILQMATMVAIILGTLFSGFLYTFLAERNQVYGASFLLVGLALAGLASSRFISRPPAADPEKRIPFNPYSGMGATLKVMWADRWLWLTALAYVYFWFAGALLQANLVPFGRDILELTPTEMSLTQGALALGIAAGALSAGFLSRGKIEVGLIPLGALGMTVFSALLSLGIFEDSSDSSYYSCLVLLFGLGFAGGIFDIPLAATLQRRSPAHMRGSIMAATNMMTFVGIFSASALMYALGDAHVPPRMIFLICSVLSLAVGIYVCLLLPIFVVRFGLWVLANTLYRVRVLGRHNIPEKGGALLVANHASFLDALIILASMDRQVRFIMYKGIYEVPWIRPLAKMMGAIPIAPGGGPREVVQSLRSATDAIKAGELVCIFAEGQITRTGQMLPFRRGFERIMKGVDAPIIPVHIDQVWGSIFSFSEGRFFWKWPDRIPYPITVAYGEPMPSDRNAFELRSAIQELGTEAFCERVGPQRLLHQTFARVARLHPFKMCVADARSGALSYIKTFAGAIILGKKLKRLLGPEKMTGILLPQSVGGTLVNIALQFMGKIPVNLNYTSSNDALRAAANTCEMKQVITAKAFLEIVPLEVPGEAIYLEDIMASVVTKDRIIAFVLACFCPTRLLEKSLGSPSGRLVDDMATVIFSSGSEGEAKGIMLSHYNIQSNIQSALQIFPYKRTERIVGMLPFFHSFGFTDTLWLVLVSGLSAVYHPNPMEARPIGDLVQKYKGTLMFSTSTFLQNFIRRCSAVQLSSLEHVITGAEKLAPRVREAFKEKFGVEPREGYGATECAPVVTLSVPDYRAPGFFQKGTKHGSIGLPIPGVSVRIAHTETGEPLQNGEAGQLQVKGPNIMMGYLGQPEKTDSVLKDGWYSTGDIAVIDEDGFITLTDRMTRFSKIAGEMVSHTTVEEALQKVVGESEGMLAVASVPDEAKGERLIVLHTLDDDDYDRLIADLDQTGLPKLWTPKSKAFYKIDEIPILGTGKMDISAVKKLARQLDIGE